MPAAKGGFCATFVQKDYARKVCQDKNNGVTSHTAAVWLAYVDTGHTATYLINTHLQLIN